jgi:aspartyl-tRNA(Asn)/glutamyl-tRNA(Gln) amidotransferase subunit A
VQPEVNAVTAVTSDLALQDAARVDAARSSGGRLPLDGLPILVKDNVDVAGIPTTAGSRLFASNVPTEDAEVVRRLRQAGAILLGKCYSHELALGVTCDGPFQGRCRNPWDADRIPGGSSGGAGAALAADLCVGAIGTDTGGSVRVPAALTGISGLRPTVGRISNRGTLPLSRTMDTVGPMARSVDDLARMYLVMAGYDPLDAPSVDLQPAPVAGPVSRRVDGTRIGVPRSFFFEGLDTGVEASVNDALVTLRGLGAVIVDVELPSAKSAHSASTLLVQIDAFALYGDDLRLRPELIGEQVRRRLLRGEAVSGGEVAHVLTKMYEWRLEVRRTFFSTGVDLLALPTTPSTAPRLAESEMLATTLHLSRLTFPWGFAGVPALSIPCGQDRLGLPVGLQLVGPQWSEATLLSVAAAYQQATDWHRRRPRNLGQG